MMIFVFLKYVFARGLCLAGDDAVLARIGDRVGHHSHIGAADEVLELALGRRLGHADNIDELRLIALGHLQLALSRRWRVSAHPD